MGELHWRRSDEDDGERVRCRGSLAAFGSAKRGGRKCSGQGSPVRARRRFPTGRAFVIAATFFVLMSAPAEAARQITPPQWFSCGKYAATVSIGPPRVWSSYNRPEHVVWMTQLQRWDANGARWYPYGPQYTTHSTFNYYGQSFTSWASQATSTGGRTRTAALTCLSDTSATTASSRRSAALMAANRGLVSFAAALLLRELGSGQPVRTGPVPSRH